MNQCNECIHKEVCKGINGLPINSFKNQYNNTDEWLVVCKYFIDKNKIIINSKV